jgi:hypothetical protein
VWVSPETYAKLPLLVPYAVRDPDAKGHVGRSIPYRWGEADDAGYMRDDNSMIKDKPYVLHVSAAHNPLYDHRRIKTGFKASHVWRRTATGDHAARVPALFSFIPNLVWLPGFLADLSDREASFTQTYLQALATRLYGHAPVSSALRPWVDRAWSQLQPPSSIPDDALPAVSTLSFFEHSDRFVLRRAASVQRVADALIARAEGRVSPRTAPRRFGESLIHLNPQVARERANDLSAYATAVQEALSS